MDPPELESESLAPKAVFDNEKLRIDKDKLDEVMGFRNIQGICKE